uniref:Uncharacterized protein n=1 Tax=Macrostomum lignano TaxID=282301 RepID=A0A1I8GNT0_9PLAT
RRPRLPVLKNKKEKRTTSTPALVSSPRPGNLSTVISICAARVATRENYPTHQAQLRCTNQPPTDMSAEPPRQPAYPALFYPAAAAAAWDFRSGGTGGGAGGSATSAAAAAAAAALLESRQPHQHHGHPQHPALHPQHPQHHHPRPAAISRNPFDPQSRIPLPHPFGEFHFGCESSFIRRRNERERERVRFVNEGYERG